MSGASVLRISGALVEAGPMPDARLYEVVQVGERRLLGEVIRIRGERTWVQVFEETSGLRVGEPVVGSHNPLSVELGPGLLGSVLDGVARPLTRIAESEGPFVPIGMRVATLDPDRQWSFDSCVAEGTEVTAGDIIGRVEEKPGLSHAIMIPPHIDSGVVASIDSGEFTVHETVATLADGSTIQLAQSWPVRRARPVRSRRGSDSRFVTGQRVLDFCFPVAEGGCVVMPGGFGTGKTVLEQSIAKYADADVVVYVGCGERGNEMAELLEDFPQLQDPRTGGRLMDRTVLVVNTSNMPVVAREASIYLGMTLAEYYRDMGLRVALLADSLSRWAEALREIGSRLQEMPAEEGYPTSMSNLLGRAYERAGAVVPLGSPDRTGAVTFLASISPPAGDFSEPVTQASLRFAGAMWALDAELAHQRHFPAVDWETSYSLYAGRLAGLEDDEELRPRILDLLRRDAELREIAGLVGAENLEPLDRLVIEVARLARESLLAQSAHDPVDAYSPPRKTTEIARQIVSELDALTERVQAGELLEELGLDAVRERIEAIRSKLFETEAEVAQ